MVIFVKLKARFFTRMTAVVFCLSFWLFFGFSSVTKAESRQCTQDEAMKAETEASNLQTWAEVFNSYKRYCQCDDGAISEGYSASVAGMLGTHWERVGELVKLIGAHPEFERFVLRHVDETMTMEQGKSIKLNAKRNCPTTAFHICVSIIQRFVDIGFPDESEGGAKSAKLTPE